MQLYLFRSAPAAYAVAFKDFYQPHNLKCTRMMAIIWLSISLTVLGSNAIFDYADKFPGAALFRVAYLSYAASATLALSAIYFLLKRGLPKTHSYFRYINLAYSFVFAVTCLLMSVANQGNPINNMTMYLMGLILVALLWVMELREVVALVFLVGLTFAIGVLFLNLSDAQLIGNQTGSVFLLIFFFLLTRLNYTFRVNHFMQLKQIEEKNAALEDVSKAKTKILGIVAHDLRGPFSNIEMLVNLMQVKELNKEEMAKYYAMIQKSCQNSKAIINDLLDMARVDQEEHYPLEKTNLNLIVEQEYQEWKEQLKDSRQLEFMALPMPAYASINSDKFKRVLDNLLSNAVKFTKENGRISIKLSQKDKEFLLQISDDGIGIPQELKPHLFNAFSRAGRHGIRGEKSVGLGLNIVQRLVEQHKGSITVESDENKGTTFNLTLPACH
ncbi:HAMP domain-containing sensor histidine kinase [uncultured Pontibacter sp.]|uniref:sensor histidine kinase n=1 Tax=uncultured Pontibacter sp. TaxID=453356 RepID=UPI00262CAB1C|nr:HAMP domain-containing sensor histidine kinase [uncultured Pontibacter sp.]